jgi:hypothetical protein
MTSRQSRIIHILAWMSLTLGAIFCLVSFVPYEMLRAVGDRLSRDGKLESFTLSRYGVEILISRWGGLFLLAAGLFAWRKDQWVFNGAAWLVGGLGRTWRLFRQDLGVLWHDLRRISVGRWEWVGLIAFSIAGMGLRAVLLTHAVEYDEAYTYTEFARYPLFQFIWDFSVPNNHIFHSILVHYSTLIFGNSLPAIRLPVYIAGSFLIILIYLLGRTLFNRSVGLLAAGLVSIFPYLVVKSTSARGYTLIAAFTVCLFLLAVYLSRKNNFAAWVLIVLIGSAGFFTNMVMVYSAAAVFLWLFLNAWDPQTRMIHSGAWNWLRRVFFSGLTMGLLSLALYLPIIIQRGIWVFLTASGNARSQELTDFIQNLPRTGQRLVQEWGVGIPESLFIVLGAGVVLSIFSAASYQRARISILAAFASATIVLFFVQRPPFLARVWLWLLPLLLLQSAAGWLGLAGWLGRFVHLQKIATASAAACLLLASAWASTNFTASYAQSMNQPADRNSLKVEDATAAFVTLFLKNRVTTDDVVLVTNCTDAQYWYYFDFYQIPAVIIRQPKNRPFNHAYAIVYPEACRQTLDDVIGAVGPDRVFLKMDQAQLIAMIGNAMIYEIDPNPAAINRTYHTP